MTDSEVQYAIRKALNNLDDWNDVTGVVLKGSSYYHELQSIIEQSVKVGIEAATKDANTDLNDI